MYYLKAATVENLYRKAARAVLAGDEVSPRGMGTRELLGVTLELTQNHFNVLTTKPMNYRFMAAEFAWMLTGQTRVDIIAAYNGNMVRYSDDGQHLAGAYGPPVTDQIPYIIETLKDDPVSRQALLTIWRPRPRFSRDIPCTVSMQFFLRSGRLDMHTYMRSNDIWYGFPYDVFNFTMLQRYIASALETDVGVYRHTVGSLHVYESNVEDLENVLSCEPQALDTADLEVCYPWPKDLMVALLTAPCVVDYEGPWRCFIDLLSNYSPEATKWGQVVSEGIKPKSWR